MNWRENEGKIERETGCERERYEERPEWERER